MADIELVIKIPEEQYDVIKSEFYNTFPAETKVWGLAAIRKGNVLPKGHGRLKDVDAFLSKVKADREHSAYVRSWTADDVLNVLNNSYAPIIIEADKKKSNVKKGGVK